MTSKELLREFIWKYRSFPCLWQVTNALYSNREARIAAYKALQVVLAKEIPNCDVESVKTKINSLRTTLRREHNKVIKLGKSGVVYKPKLWYYNLLDFVMDGEDNGTSDLHIFPEDLKSSLSDTDQAGDYLTDAATDGGSVSQAGSPSPAKSNKRKREDNEEQQPLQQTIDMLSRPGRSEDYLDHFGKYVVARLRAMNSQQCVLAEKIIGQVVFMGQMNQLTTSTFLGDNTGPTLH